MYLIKDEPFLSKKVGSGPGPGSGTIIPDLDLIWQKKVPDPTGCEQCFGWVRIQNGQRIGIHAGQIVPKKVNVLTLIFEELSVGLVASPGA
jgi:hypothetical protein